MIRVITVVLLGMILTACWQVKGTPPTSFDWGNGIVSVTVDLLLADESPHFENRTLVLKLFEYDPRLADVAATLIDSYTQVVSFKQAEEPFALVLSMGHGGKVKNNRKYYLVSTIENSHGKRTHYGYKNGVEGFTRVSVGHAVSVVLKPVK